MTRDAIIDMALDHIYEFESRSGKIKKREGIGGTVGGFHLRYKDNKNLAAAEGFTPQPGQSVEQQFNDFILADAGRERRIARRRVERDYDMFVKDGVEATSLQMGEMVAGLNMVYNAGGVRGNPGFTTALKALSVARKNEKDEHITSLYRDATRGYIDVMRTAQGDYSSGLMARTMTTKEIFDGVVDISGVYDRYLSSSRAEMKANIRMGRDTGRSFYQQARDDETYFNTHGSYPFRATPTPSPVRKAEKPQRPEMVDVVPDMTLPTPPPEGMLGKRGGSFARTLDTISPFSRIGEKM